MLWLGRILAILNLVAVAAFCYLGLETYALRKAWSRAVFAAKVTHNGLPTTADETDRDGIVMADQLDSGMLNGIPNGVTTVKLAGDALANRARSYVGEGKSRVKQIEVLLPLLTSVEERQRYIRLLAVERGDVARADLSDTEKAEINQLGSTLESVLSAKLDQYKTARAKNGKQDPKAMRREVANLYAALLEILVRDRQAGNNQSSAEQLRENLIREMALVVGMEAAGTALRQKAQVNYQMAKYLRTKVRKDRLAKFLDQHRALVAQARYFERLYQDQKFQTSKKQVQIDIQQPRTLNQQGIYEKELQQLQQMRDVNETLLKLLHEEQQTLFKLRTDLRDANRNEQAKNELVIKREKELEPIVKDLEERRKSLKERRMFLETRRQELLSILEKNADR